MKKILVIILLALSAFTLQAQNNNQEEDVQVVWTRNRIGIDYSIPDFSTKRIDASIIGDHLANMLSLLRSQYKESAYYRKEFPLQLSFNQMDDAASIRAELVDENGFHYSSDVQTIRVDGTHTLDLTGADTFVALVPKTGPCAVADAESELTQQPGELVLVPAACKQVTLQVHCLVKSIKCVN